VERTSSRASRVRGASPKKAVAVDGQYNRVGLILAIFAALWFFVALWALNGYFTASTVRAVGLLLGATSVSWGVGWLVHIIVSLIEQHLWKLRAALGNAPLPILAAIYGLIIFVGVLDVLSSALAFLVFFNSLGLLVTDPSVRFASVVLSEIIAILPEPIIVWLFLALYQVIKKK
jgi:hypothetical protein